MEYCDKGSLEDAIGRGVFHAQHFREPALEAILATLADIARAMEYLHLMRIILKDLKPKNVLLTSSQVVCCPSIHQC